MGNHRPSQMITTEQSEQNSAYGGLGSMLRAVVARDPSLGWVPRVRAPVERSGVLGVCILQRIKA